MNDQTFAIVDIETTGGQPSVDKITEIAVVLYEGGRVIETFDTLVNPERLIPPHITMLTGITQEMVAEAPRFFEVAKKVVELTKDAVFVAHNVRFDYNFIREEFRRLGYVFQRKQLCTVRMSRKAFPGLASYSLENLIRHFNITAERRHRALDDALATSTIFGMILNQSAALEDMSVMINHGIKESRLPSGITLDKLHNLPESCGVYYFHDDRGDVVYVGKSINIKKRVMEHFADQTEKGTRLHKYVSDISFETTGSELMALLHEDLEIKRLKPIVNKAQRRQFFPYGIFAYVNEQGYRCFQVAKNTAPHRKKMQLLSEFPKMPDAKSRLKNAARQFELCMALSGIEYTQGACFGFQIKQCQGACCGAEQADSYNDRANQCVESLSKSFEGSFLLVDQGRSLDEKSVVWIANGLYQGHGYASAEEGTDIEALLSNVKKQRSNPDVERILWRFLQENKTGIRKIKLD